MTLLLYLPRRSRGCFSQTTAAVPGPAISLGANDLYPALPAAIQDLPPSKRRPRRALFLVVLDCFCICKSNLIKGIDCCQYAPYTVVIGRRVNAIRHDNPSSKSLGRYPSNFLDSPAYSLPCRIAYSYSMGKRENITYRIAGVYFPVNLPVAFPGRAASQRGMSIIFGSPNVP